MSPPNRIRPIIALLSVLVIGCSTSASTISDSTYVQVMAELITNKNAPGTDTATNAQRRSEALEKFGVTEADLHRKTSLLAQNPAHFTTVWGKVRMKIAPGG